MGRLDQVLQVIDARSECPSCRRQDRYPILETDSAAEPPVVIVGWACRTCMKQGPADPEMSTAEMAGITESPGVLSEP